LVEEITSKEKFLEEHRVRVPPEMLEEQGSVKRSV
jgi:hypothetical protein